MTFSSERPTNPISGRVLVAPDKFKGSLTASAAANAIARGALRANAALEVDLAPMADGGEGTLEALAAATGGSIHKRIVKGPLGTPVEACFGLLGDGLTAVVEMAEASGLVLLEPSQKNPEKTSTFGTGELVLAAIEAGARKLIVGIGGSATNDGGAGFAAALGFGLLDSEGKPIEPTGEGLSRLSRIDVSGKNKRLAGVEIAAACDVSNPLCGPDGASAVYGPQKGATAEQIRRLDANLAHFAEIVERDLGVRVADEPGAGAAGGLGAGILAFVGGKLERGVELVIRAVNLDDRLDGCLLCLTGEGALDRSSKFGKTVVGVAHAARKKGVPVIALTGSIGPGANEVLDLGLNAYFCICQHPMPLAECIEQAETLLEQAAEQALRAFLAGMNAARPLREEAVPRREVLT